MVTENEFKLSVEKIKGFHDKAFITINSAIKCEENEKPLDAISQYKDGIDVIDEALATPIGLPDDLDDVLREQWNLTCKMIQKLKRARAEVIERVEILYQNQESPPSSSTEMQLENSNSRPRTYSELVDALRELQFNTNNDSLELLYSCDNVRLYYINHNGQVSTTSVNSTLRILRLEKNESKNLSTTFFIQIINTAQVVEQTNSPVNEPSTSSSSNATSSSLCQKTDNFDGYNNSSWIYPLIPGVSSYFCTDYGALIFPDLATEEIVASYGVVVPKENASDEIVHEILEAIIGTEKHDEKEHPRQRRSLSVKVSENIVRGANCISRNIINGAEKAGNLMSYSTPWIISKINPAPANSPQVPKNLNTGVQVAKSVTGAAAGATIYIAGKIGSATVALGKYLSPHVQKHGSSLLSKGFGLTEEDASNKMSGALTVAAGAVEGFGAIYSGLEDAANILGKNLSDNSVKIIEHKYGSSAGTVASGTFDTVGNVINVSRNISYITPKGFIKKTAKNTGKAIFQDFHPLRNTGEHSAVIHPNLQTLELELKK